jgi:hypothetical protein
LDLRVLTAPAFRLKPVEFQLDLDLRALNPYDPAEFTGHLEIQTPSGVPLLQPAYYHQPVSYARRSRDGKETDWFYLHGEGRWRARFTPEEQGVYRVRAFARHSDRTLMSSLLELHVSSGPGPGFVRVLPTDPRFFGFEDGTPFFPLGHNLAFVGPSQYLDLERLGRVFGKLREQGANFARIWVCAEDWALGLEARKSAWGRSWDWRPPWSLLPGHDAYHRDGWCAVLGGSNPLAAKLSPSMPVGVRPGTEYRLEVNVRAERAPTDLRLESSAGLAFAPLAIPRTGEWITVNQVLRTGSDQWWLGDLTLRAEGPGRLWLGGITLREVAGGPNLLWEADLARPARGVINEIDAEMLDQVLIRAEQAGIRLQLCLLTRDHYRYALAHPSSEAYDAAVRDAQRLLRYVVGRWGYSRQVLAWEYFNEMDPHAPTDRFHQALGEYLERWDAHRHLRSTSGWGPAPRHWTHPQLDIADLHWYLRPAWGPLWKDEVGAVLDRAALVLSHARGKPAVLGEWGLADDRWGLSPHMAQDREGVHLHNTLWASAFSGLSAAAAFWWWETFDAGDGYRHYRPLAGFLPHVPWGRTPLTAFVGQTDKGHRILAWTGRDCAYGWITHAHNTWAKTVLEEVRDLALTGDALRLDGLEPGAYRVAWWDTWTGEWRADAMGLGERAGLRLDLPASERDIAFLVEKQTAPATPFPAE